MAVVPALPIPEPPIPQLDPRTLVSRTCHDLTCDGIKTTFDDAEFSKALRAAVDLLQALGVSAHITDEPDFGPPGS